MPQPLTPLSWVDLDPNYANRTGYDADFLGVRVNLPALDESLGSMATVPVLAYEHFSVLLHAQRKLAFWTASNIDGAHPVVMASRQADQWWEDSRAKGYQTKSKAYTNTGFQRGHLVRRLDPAWGDDAAGSRGEADSFHWTNCSPQVPVLNTRWWYAIETHVLNTADALKDKISVFSGCVLTDQDPPGTGGVLVPLAFWKVVAWTVTGDNKKKTLRALAFVVKQDEEVAKLLKAKGVAPLAVSLDDVPESIQGYQTTVEELSAQLKIDFGPLKSDAVDVYAARRKRRLAPLMFNAFDAYRRLRVPEDLFTSIADR